MRFAGDGKKKRVGPQSALTDFLNDGSSSSNSSRRRKDPNNPFERDRHRDRTSSASSISPKPSAVSLAPQQQPMQQQKSGSDLDQLDLDLGTPYVFGGGGGAAATTKSADSLLTQSNKSNVSSNTSSKPTGNSIFNSLPTYDTSSPPTSMLKFSPRVDPVSPEPYTAGVRRENRTPPPSQHKAQLDRGRQELMRDDDVYHHSQQSPRQAQLTADQDKYQKQMQHLNQLEESQRFEDATFVLSDLCEMTLPERYHNDFKTKISVLGVEMWKSGRKTAAVERLNYVLRIWLSDVRHSTTTTAYGATAGGAAGAASPKDNVSLPPMSPAPQRGESASGESRGVVTLGAFTDRDDSENTLNTSMNDSAVSLLAGGGLSNSSMNNLDNSFKAGVSKSSMLDLEFSESAQDEYSPSKERSSSASQPSLPGLKMPGNQHSSANTPAVAAEPVFTAKPLTPFSVFSRTVVERSVASVADESWSVFTVRRDLPSLGALHAELTALLQVRCWSLDAFLLCNLHFRVLISRCPFSRTPSTLELPRTI